MMELGRALEALYPNARRFVDYTIQDDGEGPYIATWNETALGPSPSQGAIDAAIAALPNPPVYVLTSTLLARLTDAEYTAIMQGAAAQLATGNGQLSRWLDMARTAVNGVNLSDPVTISAKAALTQAKLLSADRAGVVFAP